MARGTMHAPKPDGERRRRNAPSHGEQVLTHDGETRGPELLGAYSPETLAWYGTWRTAPQAQLFQDTDWSRLSLLAPIVEAYFRRPSAAALSEIRMNEERLGATVVDRMRARIRIQEPDADEAASSGVIGSNVTPISARRDSMRARLAADTEPAIAAAPTASDPAPF
jgi:hypothetical protein